MITSSLCSLDFADEVGERGLKREIRNSPAHTKTVRITPQSTPSQNRMMTPLDDWQSRARPKHSSYPKRSVSRPFSRAGGTRSVATSGQAPQLRLGHSLSFEAFQAVSKCAKTTKRSVTSCTKPMRGRGHRIGGTGSCRCSLMSSQILQIAQMFLLHTHGEAGKC